MNSKCVRKLSKKAMPTLWASFACAKVIEEAMRRTGSASGNELGPNLRQIFELLGRDLRNTMQEALKVDARYQELRARQRRRQRRRDAIARKLYRELGEVRKRLRGLFGPQGDFWVMGLSGPTRRHPFYLWFQASEGVLWAQRHELPDTPVRGDVEGAVQMGLERIEGLANELDAALEAVGRGHKETEVVMLEQREAVKALRRVYMESAHLLEAQLLMVGLPTLAEAVRPGVGRRGRPLKTPPRDLHPDLVEKVRAEGLMVLDEAMLIPTVFGKAKLLATSRAADRDKAELVAMSSAARNGSAEVFTLPTGVRNGSGALGANDTNAGNGKLGLEKIETRVPDPATGHELIENAVPERVEGSIKIKNGVPERAPGSAKIKKVVPELVPDGVNALSKRFTGSRPVAACSRPRPRRDLTASRRRSRAAPLPVSRTRGESSLGKVRQAASAWWSKLRRASM